MIRTLSDRRPTLGDQRIQDNLAELLASTNLAITKAVGRIVMQHHLPVDLERFAAWAISATQPSTVRSQALELLADAGFARLGSILQQALEARAPEVRLTAMRLVARNNPEAFLEFLDTHESRMTLPEKQAARRLAGQVKSKKAVRFLQREMNALLLGQVPAELALDVLEACRACPDPELKTLLATYESKLPSDDPLAKFRPTLSGGNAATGRDVFRNHTSGQCARCHEAGGEGYQAGPVLAGIALRATPEYLLESLIDPSRRIAEGFASLRVETRDGEEFDGTQLGATSEELTLRLSSGEIRKLARQDITRQSTSSVSAMPPMGDILSLDEIRDLL